MEIQRVKLRGFIGLKKGLNLDEIDVDLNSLSGLVALSGDNGKGKSTFIENLHPFRCLASRSRALQHHVFLRNSLKELTFTFDGDQYRSLVKIDSQSERQEAFLYKNGNSASETNGKASEYDKAIVDLFGSQNLFFNSIFCAQNSEKLSDMRPGELKSLFSEFLRLYLLEQYEQTSKQCGIILTGQADSVSKEIDRLTSKIVEFGDIEEAMKKKSMSLIETQAKQEQLKSDLTKAESDLEKERDKLARREVEKQKIEGLKSQLEQINKNIEADHLQAEAELGEIREKVRRVLLEIASLQTMLAEKHKVEGAETRAGELDEDLRELSQHIDIRQKELDEATDSIHKAEVERAEAQTNSQDQLAIASRNLEGWRQKQRERVRAFVEAKNTLQELFDDKQLNLLRLKVDNCREKMADLEKRDPECASTICSFIVKALEAKNNLPTLDRQLAERQTEVSRLETETRAAMAQIELTLEQLSDAEKTAEKIVEDLEKKQAKADQQRAQEISGLRETKSVLQVALIKHNETASRLKAEKVRIEELVSKKPQIDIAVAKIVGLEKRKEELIADDLRVKSVWTGREDEKKLQARDIRDQIEEIKQGLGWATSETIDNLTSNIKWIKDTEIPKHEQAAASLKADIAMLNKDAVEKETAEADLKKARAKKSRIVAEASEWAYLKNACGANGLRALEIDSVAPIITGYANDLLTQTFGPNAMVSLKTQDDEGREILDIQILDEDGDSVLLGNRSGGQQVWALKAMRLAMTMISKEKSRKNFQTVLSDEETGPLDDENALKYIALYRTFMAQGGFSTCYYITHKPECVAMADHVLTFGSGGIVVD